MSEQKLQASAVPKLKKSFVLKYSTTGISLAASYALLSYVTMYASDVVGLNLATISLVLMVIILICMGIMNQFDDGEDSGKGGIML